VDFLELSSNSVRCRPKGVWPGEILQVWRELSCASESPTAITHDPLVFLYFPVFSSPTTTIEVVGNTGTMSSEKPTGHRETNADSRSHENQVVPRAHLRLS
jgi:hypothetical protein